MEFESKIAAFATGLLLLGSYIMLFNLLEYSGFFVAVSSLLLLLIAFRDHRPGRQDLIAILFAAAASAFLLIYLGNNIFIPLAVVLIASLLAIRGRIEVFIPPMAGLVTLQFADPSALLTSLEKIFGNLYPLLGINYEMSETGYLILYHTRTHLPILLDNVKLLLPFYLALLVAGLALVAILKLNRKALFWAMVAIVAIPLLFVVLSLQRLIQVPGTADFILDSAQGIVLPLSSVLLISFALPGATIRRIQTGGFTPSRTTLVLLAAFFLLAVAYLTPLVARSDPLIIIDESHSEWEPTWTDYLQTNAKDPVSGSNNYFGLMNAIYPIYNITLIIDRPEKKPAIGSVGSILVKEITPEILDRLSQGRKAVLVIKCVTRPYDKSEIDAILNFTAQGNGLILISEHTDIYGMSTNINPISERMGYRFLATGVQDVYTDARGSITLKEELPPLMARYMVGDQLWETSNSLQRLDKARPFFEVLTRPSYFAHYRNETAPFFLTRAFSEEMMLNCLFAQHLVLVGSSYGKGKAVLFTDSTDFNNGVIGIGDHLPIFLAMIEYVSTVDRFDKMLLPYLLAALALAVVMLNRRAALAALVVLSLIFLVAYTISYPMAHYTAAFPELKADSKIVLIKAERNYLQDYLSGLYDLDKLMDRYFRQNLTALIMPNPHEEWVRISARVETLQYAIADRKSASSL